MKISVIVTTWQCEPWLEECLASLRVAQAACAAEVEVIEVCDGTGVANARNQGIARASGEWLVFVDGDDVVASDFLKLVEEHADEAEVLRFRNAPFYPGEDYRRNKSFLAFPSSWTAVAYRRRTLPETGFRPLVMGEDRLFLLQCIQRAHKVLVIDRIVYGYRQHDESTTRRRVTVRRWRDRMAAARMWFAEYAARETAAGKKMQREIAAVRHVIARDLIGEPAIELKMMKENLWPEWCAHLKAVGKLGRAVPPLARLQVAICRRFRWPWVTRLVAEWPRRIFVHYGF